MIRRLLEEEETLVLHQGNFQRRKGLVTDAAENSWSALQPLHFACLVEKLACPTPS